MVQHLPSKIDLYNVARVLVLDQQINSSQQEEDVSNKPPSTKPVFLCLYLVSYHDVSSFSEITEQLVNMNACTHHKSLKLTFPTVGWLPSGTTGLLVAVGIIKTMLSISFADIKFCSSRRKYCDLDQMLKISATWLYRSSASTILCRSQ